MGIAFGISIPTLIPSLLCLPRGLGEELCLDS